MCRWEHQAKSPGALMRTRLTKKSHLIKDGNTGLNQNQTLPLKLICINVFIVLAIFLTPILIWCALLVFQTFMNYFLLCNIQIL